MTARLLQPADANVLITFWNTKAEATLANLGYFVQDLDLASLQAERTRSRWVGAFDASNNLRGVIEGITSKSTVNAIWVGRFGVDPNISLASIRTHRDDIARFLWNLIPDGWLVEIPYVRNSQIAREYCDAKFESFFDIGPERFYSSSSEHLKAVA